VTKAGFCPQSSKLPEQAKSVQKMFEIAPNPTFHERGLPKQPVGCQGGRQSNVPHSFLEVYMKLNRIVAACAALTAASAFAACPTTGAVTLDDLVNKCAPEVTFYSGGASAQSSAVNSILTASPTVFDTSKARGRVYLMSASVSGLNGVTTTDPTKSNTVGYIGFGATTSPFAGKRVLVIYNKANGANAGVFQVLAGKGSLAGEDITLKTKGNGKTDPDNTCTIVTDSTSGSLGTATCTTEASFNTAWGLDKQKSMHVAFADVYPNEATPGIIKKWDRVKFPAVATAVQGFGVIVNPALYTKLIAKNIAEGKLDAGCATSEVVGGATDVITFACQPTITKAEYSGIISGSISSSAELLADTAETTKLVLARRVDSSGTQATSHLFFGGLSGYNVKTPLVDGYLDVLNTADAKAGTLVVNPGFEVSVNSTTGDVITAVSTATDYRIGVVSLENTYNLSKSASKLKGALFVKIDGASPNMTLAGLDPKARKGLQAGYPYAYEMSTVTAAKMATDAKQANQKFIAEAITNALKDPSYDLAGLAYIGSTDTTKNTAYTRGGNNLLPLVKN
jgi:hypothetical protein